ncbi:DarT1-associated NADAR antitoxin family protein [Rhodovulum sulfidophilum]|uniref:DarT1-associated NADAR antitoxin family protein n=1 Tax=Rhodovulum sulfidophilum TaxID=35806 RepID=UPI0009525263|nr:hypothetical protein [Rhodovulum sulfidophilum]OLS47698.1 hypothetical protein BV379_04935 [Rhodovulum sulfidophilum]
MASRPVFLPVFNGPRIVQERQFDFTWAPGFAEVQKKKNISALHEAARKHGIEKILEISSKSENELGRRLSAFSLKVRVGECCYPLESVYQGSKVFEDAGPFPDIFEMPPRDAKRFIREKKAGNLVAFELEQKRFPLSPKNAFYDWLYIRALSDHAGWIKRNVDYDAYADIEFNPAKQVNCQARAFAEYLSLMRQGKLHEAVGDFNSFSKMISGL